MLVRTQILLDLETKREIKELAQSEGKSLSQIIRESVKNTVEKKTRKLSSYEFLKRLVERAGSSKSPIKSTNVDDYLYGKYRIE